MAYELAEQPVDDVATETPELSVVLAALNEAGNIGPLVAAIHEIANRLGVSHEILVVDGGSRDNTRAEAEAAGARTMLQRRLGYGGAMREGFAAARGRFVLTIDADGSHTPELIPALWAQREHADIIIASRFIAGGSSRAPAMRQILSKILNGVFRAALGLQIADTSSGYRLYRRQVLKPAAYRYENFSILQEVLVRAIADGYSVREVPLGMLPRGAGSSHVSFVRFCISYASTLYHMWLLRNSPESADYDSRAYKSRNPVQRFWQRRRTELLEELAAGEGKMLNIGCGSSMFQQRHPEAVGLDIEIAKLRYLRLNSPERVQADTAALPIRDAGVRRVVLSQVLQHTSHPEQVLRELYRVLESGGTLVVGVPDEGRLQWRIIGFLYWCFFPNMRSERRASHFSRHSLVEMLADSGFRVERVRYIAQAEVLLRATKLGA